MEHDHAENKSGQCEDETLRTTDDDDDDTRVRNFIKSEDSGAHEHCDPSALPGRARRFCALT